MGKLLAVCVWVCVTAGGMYAYATTAPWLVLHSTWPVIKCRNVGRLNK